MRDVKLARCHKLHVNGLISDQNELTLLTRSLSQSSYGQKIYLAIIFTIFLLSRTKLRYTVH